MINDTYVNPKNIFSEYEGLTVADIKAHAMTYNVQKTRQDQNYVQMY